MLKLSATEFFIRLIPESFVFVFASYAFTNTRINKARYAKSVLFLIIAVFFIRMLPINYGVHTILNIIFLTIITIYINKLDIIKATRASIITSILLFTLEGINVGVLWIIYGNGTSYILSDHVRRVLYGIPSLIAYAIIVFVCYFISKRKGRLRNV